MNILSNFVPVSFDVLVDGLKIDYSIYFRKDGNYVLLCRNVTLTEKLINQLRKVSGFSKNIYVPMTVRDGLMYGNAYVKMQEAQKELEDAIQYTEVKNASKNMFDIITTDNKVPAVVTNTLSMMLSKKMETIDNTLLLQCVNGIRNVDEYLYTHSVNVAMLSNLIGKWAGFPKDKCEKLIKIGLLHDIGKLRVPPEVLNKKEALTAEEFDIIKLHSNHAYDMLVESGIKDEEILQAVLHHHERVNGTGYPDKLLFQDIPLYSRIVSVADVYDAMVSKRVYKSAHSPFEILNEFFNGKYSYLDIDFVNVFLNYMPHELTGKLVLLSDNSIAEVAHVNPLNFEYPLVKRSDQFITTSKDLYCVSMYLDKETTHAELSS